MKRLLAAVLILASIDSKCQTTSDCQIQVPNCFTPNGDPVDGYFRPAKQQNVEFMLFLIKDTLNQIVYKSYGACNGWDGYYNGILQNNGTYVYLIEYKYKEKRQIKVGEVNLIK